MASLGEAVRADDGHEDVTTLFDPTGQILSLWAGSSSLSAFVDGDQVMASKLVYEGNVGANTGEIDATLAR